MPASFTVGMLCYGDFPEMVDKCLGTLFTTLDPSVVKDVRIGMNQCSAMTASVIRVIAMNAPVPVYGYQVPSGQNQEIYKYPIMRAMLYHSLPVRSSHWMWFDDDTFVKDQAQAMWMRDLAEVAENYDLIGYQRRLRIRLRPGQIEGIRRQGWFGGRPISDPGILFPQGGWWTARTSLLASWSYPFKELRHNNGDVLLGELSHQQKWRTLYLEEKKGPVAVDAHKRRGIQGTPWPWQTGGPTDLQHHSIRIVVERLNSLGDAACQLNSKTHSEMMTSIPA